MSALARRPAARALVPAVLVLAVAVRAGNDRLPIRAMTSIDGLAGDQAHPVVYDVLETDRGTYWVVWVGSLLLFGLGFRLLRVFETPESLT